MQPWLVSHDQACPSLGLLGAGIAWCAPPCLEVSGFDGVTGFVLCAWESVRTVLGSLCFGGGGGGGREMGRMGENTGSWEENRTQQKGRLCLARCRGYPSFSMYLNTGRGEAHECVCLCVSVCLFWLCLRGQVCVNVRGGST